MNACMAYVRVCRVVQPVELDGVMQHAQKDERRGPRGLELSAASNQAGGIRACRGVREQAIRVSKNNTSTWHQEPKACGLNLVSYCTYVIPHQRDIIGPRTPEVHKSKKVINARAALLASVA